MSEELISEIIVGIVGLFFLIIFFEYKRFRKNRRDFRNFRRDIELRVDDFNRALERIQGGYTP